MAEFFYTNMDRKLIKKGGRKSVKITEEDFKDIIYRASNGKSNSKDKAPKNFSDSHINYWNLIEGNKVREDLEKIFFDSENNFVSKDRTPLIDESVPNLIGINTLNNGLTFLGCMAGGDWEYPLFFIIYYDGENLRGYIPSYGNVINLDFKSAFGSELDSSNSDTTLTKKEYIKLLDGRYAFDLQDEAGEYDYSEFTLHYLRKLGAMRDLDKTLTVNWEAVKEDIENRIEIK